MRRVWISLLGPMLAGPALAQSAPIPPKTYRCHNGGDDLGVAIVITGPATYTDGSKPGAYSYDPGTGTITFRSGTYYGIRSKYLGNGVIGLASSPADPWTTVCD